MNYLIDQPSWSDAPAGATHLLRHDSIRPHEVYAWAWDGGDRRLYAGPPGHVDARLQLVVGDGDDLWKLVEARPAAPAQRTTGSFVREQMQQYLAAQAEQARCGQCHFAGPEDRGLCLCRRYAPQGTRQPHQAVDFPRLSAVAAFPIMRAEHDWCGEFIRRASEGGQP